MMINYIFMMINAAITKKDMKPKKIINFLSCVLNNEETNYQPKLKKYQLLIEFTYEEVIFCHHIENKFPIQFYLSFLI